MPLIKKGVTLGGAVIASNLIDILAVTDSIFWDISLNIQKMILNKNILNLWESFRQKFRPEFRFFTRNFPFYEQHLDFDRNSVFKDTLIFIQHFDVCTGIFGSTVVTRW